MTRRKIREEIFKALFQAEFHSEEEMPEQVDRFIEDEEPPIIDKEERDYIAEKTNAILEKIVEIDAYLAGVTRIKRMLGIDKRRYAALLLGIGNNMQCESRLA